MLKAGQLKYAGTWGLAPGSNFLADPVKGFG